MTCPICRRAITWENNTWRPFCSERCQTIDLGAWAGEVYRVPGLNMTMELPDHDISEPDEA